MIQITEQKMEIDIDGTKIALTIEQARELRDALDGLLGKNYPTTISPITGVPIPTYPFPMKPWSPDMEPCRVTCCAKHY